jgi:SAM-dependent methyltransferase
MAVGQAVGQEFVRLASLTDGGYIVDVGAGTGDLGYGAIGLGLAYIGLDMSLPMLRVFGAKIARLSTERTDGRSSDHAAAKHSLLAVADADAPWPLQADSAAIVFFSRAVHLLDQEHIVTQSLRVARSDTAFLVIGRVRRSADSVRSMLRREMQRQLRRHGIVGRKGEEASRGLATAIRAQGCLAREPEQIVVAGWTVEEQPGASLAGWRSKEGLAGEPVPSDMQHTVLDELERWAEKHFGNLQAVRTAQEEYELTVIAMRKSAGMQAQMRKD